MTRALFCFVVLAACVGPRSLIGQHSLSVRVEGIASSEGTLEVALYDQKKFFLKMQGIYQAKRVPAREGATEFKLQDLPSGEYALAIYHDENGNGELDTNWIGIPKEPLGFSNARLKTFGPPRFEECLIRLRSDTRLLIRME